MWDILGQTWPEDVSIFNIKYNISVHRVKYATVDDKYEIKWQYWTIHTD